MLDKYPLDLEVGHHAQRLPHAAEGLGLDAPMEMLTPWLQRCFRDQDGVYHGEARLPDREG